MSITKTTTNRTTTQLMTQEGYDSLRRELRSLIDRSRPELAERLREARADGGNAAENGELMQAMQDSQRLEQRIRNLEARLAVARIAEPARDDGIAGVGTSVRLRSQVEGVLQYHLVGVGESDPSRGRISIGSPLGQAVRGRRPGETFDVKTPKQDIRFEVLAVEPFSRRGPLAQAA
jgi:transcription elongation GreA/GreB family factor